MFKSAVQSGFLASRASDQDQDQSLKFQNVQKIRLNLFQPVFYGFFAKLNWLWSQLVHNWCGPVLTSLDALGFKGMYLTIYMSTYESIG